MVIMHIALFQKYTNVVLLQNAQHFELLSILSTGPEPDCRPGGSLSGGPLQSAQRTNYPQENMATIKDVGAFYAKIRERIPFHNWATSYLKLYQFLFNQDSSFLLSYRCKRQAQENKLELLSHLFQDVKMSLFQLVPAARRDQLLRITASQGNNPYCDLKKKIVNNPGMNHTMINYQVYWVSSINLKKCPFFPSRGNMS